MKITPIKFFFRTLFLPNAEKEYVKLFSLALGETLVPQDVGYHEFAVCESKISWGEIHEVKMERISASRLPGFLLHMSVHTNANTFTLHRHNLPVSDKAVDACCTYVRDYVIQTDERRRKLSEEDTERKKLEQLRLQSERLQSELLKFKGVKPDDGITKAANVAKEILTKGKEIQRLTSEVKELRNEAIKELTAA